MRTILFAMAASFLAISVWSQTQYPVISEVGGPTALSGFGYSVRSLGDVDNDGVPDFVAGSPFLFQNTGGFGVFSGVDTSLLHSGLGQTAGEQLGFSVAAIGDFDGDGTPDWAVAAPTCPNGGRVDIYAGATGSLIMSLNAESIGDRFGYSVEGAGDVNDDGFDDLVVGAPFWDRPSGDIDTGKIYVFLGPNGSLFDSAEGEAFDDLFGSALASLGDIDGDFKSDIVIGARWHNSLGFSNNGRAYVRSPATQTTIYTFDGEVGGDQLGVALGGGGDVDNDGTPDILIGAMQNDTGAPNVGRAYARSGATGALLYMWTGDLAQDHIGSAIADAGDVNGDGFDDIVLGGLTFPLGIGTGILQVYSGKDGSRLFEEIGDLAGDFYAYAVDGAGDVNGDGLDDIVSGGLFSSAIGGLGTAGMIRVFSVMGAQQYGTSTGVQGDLELSWDAFFDGFSGGEIRASGADPFASGVILVGLASAQTSFAGVPLLVDPAASLTLVLDNITYDQQGEFRVPVNLNVASLHGISLYLQVFETSLNIETSNGLQLLFSQ
ncbi:MAG: hypothetical protein V3W41_17815 [Planctomycetota bacterium]